MVKELCCPSYKRLFWLQTCYTCNVEWVGGLIKFSSPQKSQTTCCACSIIDINLVWLVKNRRTLNKKNREPSRLYLAFYSWAFSKTQTYHSLRMPYIWHKFGCEMWVTKGTLLWEQRNFLVCISLSIRGIFQKLNNLHTMCMPYNRCKLGWDRSVTKGTLLKEQRTFWAVSRLIFKALFLKRKPLSHCACATFSIS